MPPGPAQSAVGPGRIHCPPACKHSTEDNQPNHRRQQHHFHFRCAHHRPEAHQGDCRSLFRYPRESFFQECSLAANPGFSFEGVFRSSSYLDLSPGPACIEISHVQADCGPVGTPQAGDTNQCHSGEARQCRQASPLSRSGGSIWQPSGRRCHVDRPKNFAAFLLLAPAV